MIRDNSVSSKTLDVIIHITMIVMLLITLYPVLYVFAASLSSASANDRGIVTIFPREFTFQSYKMIWQARTVPLSFKNSVIYTSLGTVMDLFFTGSLAYALSRKKLALRKLYTALILFSMYFSGGMIPSFLLVRNLGLYNSMWSLILPGLIGTTNLIIMRTFFQAIPQELEESAYLDGANDFVVFFRIVLPLSKAAIFTIGLYYAVGHWNSWFNAMISLKDTAKYPLQMILRQIVIQATALSEAAQSADASQQNEIGIVNVTGVKFATLSVSIIPMLLIYPFIQKYFIKGVMIGSLKG